MSNTSNFRQAFQQARNQSLVGPNVIANALPYVGGGLVLTAVGTYGGLGIIRSHPELFFPTFIGAMVLELILFFVAQNVASKGNNSVALPLLGIYSLFAGASVVDFYILPRTYRNEEYLRAALSMYLTYINLFVFILRLLIAINGRD
ncbi:MAG: hypothetical protein EAZ76_07910 [Nostocales cyanobacterium]|nr:MAG: hypothetical protein EAZ87_20335 [Nostocales cyanobacterium]TAF16153.1 MAG: hypothetical protein EAZ76_07910 [Nostocales cyanobacterium]